MVTILFEGFFRILGILSVIPFYYSFEISRPIFYPSILYNYTIDISEDIALQKNYLMNNPLFQNRKKYVKFFQSNYEFSQTQVDFSIVIATHERTQCLQRIFNHLIKNRPNSTEIIISDDASESKEKNSYLKEISEKYNDSDVYVIQHTVSCGAFHTKLDGFLFSVGSFIMSIDDDDFFDDQYFIELSSRTIEEVSKNNEINFVIALNFPYIQKWITLPFSVLEMIKGFHNHVDFAFRRSLLADIDYPLNDFKIIRDDAPLMIPLYIKTNDSQIIYFHNRNAYRVDGRCMSNHQSNQYVMKRQQYINGYNFLSNYIKSINRTDIEPLIKAAYNLR